MDRASVVKLTLPTGFLSPPGSRSTEQNPKPPALNDKTNTTSSKPCLGGLEVPFRA